MLFISFFVISSFDNILITKSPSFEKEIALSFIFNIALTVVIAIDDGGITLDIAKTLLNIGISRFDHIHNWLRSVEV